MSIEVASCPLCGTAYSQTFDQREFRGYPVSNRICSTCGLVFQSPRMSDEELSQFYAEEYRKLYQGNAGPDPKDLAVVCRKLWKNSAVRRNEPAPPCVSCW